MKSFKLQKSLLAIAASVLAFGFAAPAAQAATAPVFTVNTTSILGAGNGKTFNATQMTGISSELLLTNYLTQTHAGSGWIQFTGFSNGASAVFPSASGLGVTYQLFATFQLSDVVTTGTINTPGSSGFVTQLDFRFYADVGDPSLGNTFASADATTATPASYTDLGAPDILLGVGSLISGVDGISLQGGAYFNSIEQFAVCTGAGTGDVQGKPAVGPIGTLAAECTSNAGQGFFAAPIPFYGLAFDSFNNTSQGPTVAGPYLSINQAVGNVDFNRIPEPGSLALLGLGLLGVGATVRRRSV